MQEEKSVAVINETELDSISNQIVNAKTSQEVKDLTDAFLLAHMKKDAIRSASLSNLRDDLLKELKRRASERSDEISNRDLIDFINLVSAQEDKAKESVVNPKKEPNVTINDNSINIVNNGENLDTESRRKIMEFIKAVTENKVSENDIIDAEIEEPKGD